MVNKQVILITGASSGIGAATAHLLAEQGARVFLGARRVERLEKICNELHAQGYEADYCKLDVTDEKSMHHFVDSARKVYGNIDVLINNAGVMLLSKVSDIKTKEWQQMINVNLMGVLNGTAAVLPYMKEQKHGMIININSTAGYRVSPGAAVYSATKYAVRAFSEGLRKEESNNGIRVCMVAPGPTRTELLSHVSDNEIRENLTDYVDRRGLNPMDVAKAVVFLINQPLNASVDELIISPTCKNV
jgi:NADP-dependent 3-hydroxy acid dehydrogenase YdfG